MKVERQTPNVKRLLLVSVALLLGSLALAQNLTFDTALAKADS